MAKKFYSVRKGNNVGIFYSWNECQKQINGYSGAEYKSFLSLEEAEEYLFHSPKKVISPLNSTEAIAYVDGSYDSSLNAFSCGIVFFYRGNEQYFSQAFQNQDISEMRNVAGEIKGAEVAIQYCLDNDIKSLTIYHDYEGISKWCTGEWKTNKEGTKAYKAFYDKAASYVNICFVKVRGHSGNKYNELADKLAKKVLNSNAVINTENQGEIALAKNRSFFIERSKIKDEINAIGSKLWNNFEASDLFKVGNAFRCEVTAEGKKAMLNFYYRQDGSTTITPTGTNTEISQAIKAGMEDKCSCATDMNGKSHSFKKLPVEWTQKLIGYMSGLEGVRYTCETISKAPIHEVHKFSGSKGDSLTINVYETGTVTLQGKPAYLYGEAISLLSYCSDISIEDIVDTINTFHNINIKTSEVRDELQLLLPNAYDHIDDMVIKLLSPSISLRKVKIEIEDYSCYAFPALRALEGYMKYLFGLKFVEVKHNFAGIYSKGILTPDVSAKISDAVYQQELERLYDYLLKNRHVIFHTEQVLIATTILEDKIEADTIVNDVINLIETSYVNISR